MTKNDMSSRRYFLKAGAMLAAPLAAMSGAALASDGSKARLAQLEDERALRDLHQTWMRNANAETMLRRGLPRLNPDAVAVGDKIRSIMANQVGPTDEIEIAAGGKRATGRFHCAVELETPIAPTCTLARMAHLQGGGFVRRTEARVLTIDYVKADGVWSIVLAKLATTLV